MSLAVWEVVVHESWLKAETWSIIMLLEKKPIYEASFSGRTAWRFLIREVCGAVLTIQQQWLLATVDQNIYYLWACLVKKISSTSMNQTVKEKVDWSSVSSKRHNFQHP